MRTLKYAILGLINKNPISGYDIAKEFGEELINFWSAKHSQIYPELKKLVEEELIEYQIVISGDILEKKVYSITEKGRKSFVEWLEKDEEIEATAKDKFRLKVYFSKSMEPIVFKKLVESQLEQRKKKLSFLTNRLKIYSDKPEYGSEKFGGYIVLTGAIIREEGYIKWLELCLKECE